jgi:cell division ATPase FtsA
MGLFSNTRKESHIALLIDVGSGSVGASLVSYSYTKEGKQEKPVILYSLRKAFTLTESASYDQLVLLMKKNLREILGVIHDVKLGLPDKVYAVLSAPWYTSQTRTILYNKKPAFTVTEKLINELVKKEVEFFKETVSPQIEGEAYIIENTIQSVMLNGYTLTDPINKKAEELKVSLFLSLSPRQVIDVIHEEVEQVYRLKKIQFSSGGACCFVALRDVFSNEDSFIVVSVGSEVTDVVLVRNHTLATTFTFPKGTHSVYRMISESLSIDVGEARTHALLCENGHASAEMIRTISPLLLNARNEWTEMFSKSLSTFVNDLSIPHTVFVLAPEDLGCWYRDSIVSESFHQYTLTEKDFNVILIGSETLHEYIIQKEGVAQDSFMSLQSLFTKRYLEN